MSLAVDTAKPDAAPPAARATVSYFPHASFKPSPLNPRKQKRSDTAIAELAQSIADKGLLHNLVARKMADGKLEIAAGEGRWLAIGKLIAAGSWPKDRTLPVQIRELTDAQMIEIGLIENLQRNDLHPLDEARAYADYTALKAKDGGKHGAANAVRDLASEINKTPRYVQKRIKLATGLAPEAAKLFGDGALPLSVAQTLSTVDAKTQGKALQDFKREDGSVDVEALKLATISDFDETITQQWRQLSTAVFDLSKYKGPVEEFDGVEFATDHKAFDKLQKEKAVELAVHYQGLAKSGAIAFFVQDRYFPAWQYKPGSGEKGGVFLEINDREGRVDIHAGLAKGPHLLAQEKREAEERQKKQTKGKAAAKPRKVETPKPDPRVPQVRKFALEHPATMLAIRLYECMTVSGTDTRITWLRQEWDDASVRGKVGAALSEVKGCPGKKQGADFLKWLLAQKAETLLPAWTALEGHKIHDLYRTMKTVPAPDQVLFNHCSAVLPAKAAEEVERKALNRGETISQDPSGKKEIVHRSGARTLLKAADRGKKKGK